MSANKGDLIKHVALYNGITQKDAKQIVESTLDFIMDQNANGEKVRLMGFGTFEPRVRKAHKGVNPQTGESMMIKETITPRFRPGKAYRERVKKQAE